MINDTFWDRTTSLPIVGPVSESNWQTLQAFPVTGPYLQYRIQGGHLYIDPTPSANSAAFEYKSTYFCESAAGVGKARWSADTDVGRLDENIMSLGIVWRWLKRKGLDYQEDFITYEKRIEAAISRDKSKRVLNMGAGQSQRVPGVVVPVGSWNI